MASRAMQAYYDTECEECGGFIFEGDDFHFVDGDKWCPDCVEQADQKRKVQFDLSGSGREPISSKVSEPAKGQDMEVRMSDPFAQDGGLPSVSFGGRDQNNQITTKPVGYKVKLLVTKAPTLVQSRQYGGTALLFWDPNKKGSKVTEPNDQPCMSVVLHGKVVADSNNEDLGVEKALWAAKPSNLFIEIGNAIKAAGLPDGIQVGCTIEVELTGFKQGEDQSKAAAKQYKVVIAGVNAFAEAPTSAAAAPAGPPPPSAAGPAGPSGPAGPPPPPPAAPVLVDGYDKAAYIATGWTEEGMKAEAKFAPFFAAPAAPAGPPPPPAGPAAPAEDPAAKRAAALAAMSEEDKKALGLA